MNKTLKLTAVSMFSVVFLVACGVGKSTPQATPQTDFHSYINAEWLKETKLGEGQAQIDNFAQMTDRTQEKIREMIDQLDENYQHLKIGSEERKLIDFYRLAADFETRNKLGIEPLKPFLDEIQKASTMDEVSKIFVSMYGKNIRTLINFSVTQDIKDSNKNSLYINPHKLSFAKENYEGTDDFSKKSQKAFKEYLQKIFYLIGDDSKEAAAKAELVFNLEKEMALVQRPKKEADNFDARYNQKTWDEVKALAPNLPISALASELELEHAATMVVSEPDALKKLNELYQEKNLAALKALLQYRLIAHYSNYLSEDIIEAKATYEGAMEGTLNIPSHDEVVESAVDENFADLIGKLYVKNHFSEESKADVLKMVEEIKSTYRERIQAVQWMSEETKAHALKKLDSMGVKIGYPDQWKDYTNFSIQAKEDGGSLLSNIDTIQMSKLKEEFAELNKPFDKTHFGMPAHAVNAFYSPSNNEIVFPAGILQAPFYDPSASPEENLGGIGAVIGHEISHAFDRAGSQFDEKGNLVNWWQPEDLEKFKAKVQQAADIYSKLEVAPGYYVNGEISTGEIIADLGGMTVAIDIAKKKGYDTKKVFEAYGKVWREVTTKEFAIANITDEHPPAKYRVNNIVNQLEQFYIDFNVKEGDPMYVKPEERLKVW
ncbi:M13 family metallopeptidase [Streptococcus suis]|uniref:M13 family metallopeptidase n=1 Tax=Streptococcus suis TaxID=1307 RepID=UPI00114767C8|nr:M13 family metallopeptidase [Streptococcus suis]TQE46057.1 M13 family metallopeptidase [Streptococcus suis]